MVSAWLEFNGNDPAADTAAIVSSTFGLVGVFALCWTAGFTSVIGSFRFVDIVER